MESEYETKFEQMKKYIPFLEGMIKRLQGVSSSNLNPRQAQLDKIKSLRDLLLDKKKRMKMENLLKCEQVLHNLYAKVERDVDPDAKKTEADHYSKTNLKESSNIEVARRKLNALKTQSELSVEVRKNDKSISPSCANDISLFQRRQIKTSVSPVHIISSDSNSPKNTKRNYTRVLKSPEPARKWQTNEGELFTRRPQNNSPRRCSPSHRKEKKKSKNKAKNIYLNVPKESLNTFNTDNIMSRVIDCRDDDVDISTLREIRRQILNELKDSGVDDLSKLLLQPFEKQKKPKNVERKKEVEDGELSDSESEAIEKIYSNIVVVKSDSQKHTSVNQDDSINGSNSTPTKKIQICLVIKSDHDNINSKIENIDKSDFELFEEKPKSDKIDKDKSNKVENFCEDSSKKESKPQETSTETQLDCGLYTEGSNTDNSKSNISNIENLNIIKSDMEDNANKKFKANFYNPVNDLEANNVSESLKNVAADIPTTFAPENSQKESYYSENDEKTQNEIATQSETQIPKSVTKDVVSEIDILQALKNEILSEDIPVPKVDVATPPLHQPKITKVLKNHDISTKKRISIENYKKKIISTTPVSNSLFTKEPTLNLTKEDQSRKLSLKLTEKECERFNLGFKMPLTESSDEDEKYKNDLDNELDEIYGDLAPESPDNDISDIEVKAPVIIPAEPIETLPSVNTEVDIDMRKVTLPSNVSMRNDIPDFGKQDLSNFSKLSGNSSSVDPRVNREINKVSNSQVAGSLDTTTNMPLISPSRTPNVPNDICNAPNLPTFVNHPSMTPNARSYSITPIYTPFEGEEQTTKKHVYAPIFSSRDSNDRREMSISREINSSQASNDRRWSSSSWEYRDNCASIRNDNPNEDNNVYKTSGDNFHPDVPMTPIHYFGRNDCPTTPVHPFGRSEIPMTPSHSFGRQDISNLSHSYGRKEIMNQAYSRSEYIATPSHPFGRADQPMTPSHTFGRSEYFRDHSSTYNIKSDTRWNRIAEYDSRVLFEDRDMYNSRVDRSQNRNFYDRTIKNQPPQYMMCNPRSSRYDNGREFERDSLRNDHKSERDNLRRSKDVREITPCRNSSSRSSYSSQKGNKETKPFDKLSTKYNASNSITIDTSISRTFQKLNNAEPIVDNFDYRRARAASVGRSLSRVSNVSSNDSFRKFHLDSTSLNNNLMRNNFKRARSVGRDNIVLNSEKSFSDLKAEFESYSKKFPESKIKSFDKKLPDRKNNYDFNVIKNKNKYEKDMNTDIRKTRQYSPKKNARDPRVQRGSYNDIKKRHETKYDICGRSSTHGIVYSHNNIVQGNVLSSGYGVKNYKIPKIKKSAEKEETNEKKEDLKVEDHKCNKIEKLKVIDKEPKKDAIKKDLKNNVEDELKAIKNMDSVLEETENKNTKTECTSKNIKERELDNVMKNPENENGEIKLKKDSLDQNITKKNECALSESVSIHHDDSLLEEKQVVEIREPESLLGNKAIFETKSLSPKKLSKSSSDTNKKDHISNVNDIFNSSNKSELEHKITIVDSMDTCFENDESENFAEPVLKNINALIADLDKDITDLPNQNLSIQQDVVSSDEKINSETELSKEVKAKKTSDDEVCSDICKGQNDFFQESECNEATVTTSCIDDKLNNVCSVVSKSNQQNLSPTQDEFIKSISEPKTSLSQNEIPDSTNELNPETKTTDENIINKPLNEIESILSILQDRAKIQELLAKLANQSSDNEKIKKKLEKISEIVSEDGDTNVDNTEKQCVDNNESYIQNTQVEVATNNLTENVTNESVTILMNKPLISEELDLPLNTKIQKKDDKLATKTKKTQLKKTKSKVKKLNVNSGVRITRSQQTKRKINRRTRGEVEKLKEDLKEMFESDDILNSTGIRMCRIAKLIDDNPKRVENAMPNDNIPLAMLQKGKDQQICKEQDLLTKTGNKQTKSKSVEKNNIHQLKQLESKPLKKNKPGPKKKSKLDINFDPYAFESDSMSDTTVNKKVMPTESVNQKSSESESESVVSYNSSESIDITKKKSKRKRSAWKDGIIKPKNKKKKLENNFDNQVIKAYKSDFSGDCFTDKNYCFVKDVSDYSCRFCNYNGSNIVLHYKKNHPHTEIPLSRISSEVAAEAIEQCEDSNFTTICKIGTDNYICRFCFKVFKKEANKKKSILETFFWHVVSTHTGEYKQNCSECLDKYSCSFSLDIPSPPKITNTQLVGYICGKCYYTQISLENLKTHVIVRHNDEQTEVFTINLSHLTKTTIESLLNRSAKSDQPKVLRSLRSSMRFDNSRESDKSLEDKEEDLNKASPKQKCKKSNEKEHKTKPNIIFENEVNFNNVLSYSSATNIKVEKEDTCEEHLNESDKDNDSVRNEDLLQNQLNASFDSTIKDCPHFKVSYSETGNKEYICCINGIANHYKTTLLISMKKHITLKHVDDWDGYCFICKLIVTSQGKHDFKECFEHYIDKHVDDMPVTDKENNDSEIVDDETLAVPIQKTSTPVTKTFINVRPLSELLSSSETPLHVPKIEQVVSLGASENKSVLSQFLDPQPILYNHEQVQSEIMSRKHSFILDIMMAHCKLIHVFKCAGRYCSFSTNSVEDALSHVSTHQRLGGDNTSTCSYCDFDCCNNIVDLVTHIFKNHGRCPFSCSICFYRASASQLVASHILRIHKKTPDNNMILRATVAPKNITDDSADLLPRDRAVPYYECKHDNCSFRTYIGSGFEKHLQTRHKSESRHPCYVCSEQCIGVAELVAHLKTHGLSLYQCAFCYHGADNERDFLTHASQKHPHKEPQAYLRIVTTKEGSSELRVLRLVNLTRSVLAVRDVSPSSYHENPVKEAERALALENLMKTTIKEVASSSEQHLNSSDGTVVNEEILPIDDSQPAKNPQNDSVQPLSSEIKEEILLQPKPFESNIIISLDSDDEDNDNSIISDHSEVSLTRRDDNVINVSDDDVTSTSVSLSTRATSSKIAPKSRNLHCPRCDFTSNIKLYGVFKRHLYKCYPDPSEPVVCNKCQLKFSFIQEFLNHFLEIFECSVCNCKETTVTNIRRHFKIAHHSQNIVFSWSDLTKCKCVITAHLNSKAQKIKTPIKIKPSTESMPTTSKQQYGPQDVDLLPQKQILDQPVYCTLCEFKTKVRFNMVRHLQLHSKQQPVAQTAPVNPVPHLETNEMHFNKMLNLASSSIIGSGERHARTDNIGVVNLISANQALRYPKYVPERQRFACGARACSYISIDEGMLKHHWDTLHAGSNDFKCVHCPPNQSLDTSKALTALRIIAHLKMHEIELFACSVCTYYHYKSQIVEKHLRDVHKNGKVIKVREESTNPVTPTPSNIGAPTMDLKPWQCGLCEFKSMLRPEVVEHCAKIHQSKMQYRCAYCPFRTSTPENVSKHQGSSHADKPSETIYFYYKEGSIPDDPDGTKRWEKQRLMIGYKETEVKTEKDNEAQKGSNVPVTVLPVDLNTVKKEVIDPSECNTTTSELLKKYSQFCEPDNLKYKCPLCKIVMGECRESMQSHLYEELKYRKWYCSLCSYKAFHKKGLLQHISSEHAGLKVEPTELCPDVEIETWVENCLIYQQNKMNKGKLDVNEKNPSNLQDTAQVINQPTSKLISPEEKSNQKDNNIEDPEGLEQAFGPFGAPEKSSFLCPKCQFSCKEESVMRDHLEIELSKIRWKCSVCVENFKTYHEVQFHCKSVHAGQPSRPVEAIRNPVLRAAWVFAVITSQKDKIGKNSEIVFTDAGGAEEDNQENSLLVVRYEEKVPALEEVFMKKFAEPQSQHDSDDDNLIIDEVPSPQQKVSTQNSQTAVNNSCPYCDYHVVDDNDYHAHVIQHYNLKPYMCPHCGLNGDMSEMAAHVEERHPKQRKSVYRVAIPSHPPPSSEIATTKPDEQVVCIQCKCVLTKSAANNHTHDGIKAYFAKATEKAACSTCRKLILLGDFLKHMSKHSPKPPVDTSLLKYSCNYCSKRFKLVHFLKIHHAAVHRGMDLSYTSDIDGKIETVTVSGSKRKLGEEQMEDCKRVAKKSTTKLPMHNTVARKSTTKLPDQVVISDDEEEYSYYGTKPTPIEDMPNVTTSMMFCNTIMPFTLKKLSEIINFEPEVVLKDVNGQSSYLS